MANNVGTPRFYVDILQWLKSQGSLSVASSEWETDNLLDLIGINPSESKQLILSDTNPDIGENDTIVYVSSFPFKSLMPNDKNFFMVLGHNLASAGASIYLQEGDGQYDSLAASGLVNYTYYGEDSIIGNDGFSISTGNDAHDVDASRVSFRFDSISDGFSNDIKIGSMLYGNYYDMPHSPDLSLKLSYEMDGIKNIQTKGGATLSNATYTKPADWGSGGAWQLNSNEAGQGLSNLRSGRRTWDLSFSYLSDTDVMPENGITANGDYDTNILDGNNFFSQVWNKTMGGHLPFIFQPDGGDNSTNSPDGFAIARFDQSSLQYEQVAHNTYNVKLKIRESW